MVSQLYFGYFLLWLCEGGSERTVIISYSLFFYFRSWTKLEEVVPCFFLFIYCFTLLIAMYISGFFLKGV